MSLRYRGAEGTQKMWWWHEVDREQKHQKWAATRDAYRAANC